MLLEGTDSSDLRLNDLRAGFGLVLQENALFSGSIHNNITLGNKNITREQVIAAAKEVEAHHFISKLPGTYDYKLRERGASLSMGQRQLICFVRAMVYNRKILILDEATSNVDRKTEDLVSRACARIMNGRNSIVITYLLSTIKDAN